MGTAGAAVRACSPTLPLPGPRRARCLRRPPALAAVADAFGRILPAGAGTPDQGSGKHNGPAPPGAGP
ncbi:hypothetical protein SPRI_2711 [Streptomyces pristinaespiralis]|uniref:Uncharacterized protein n=1 Tax=Streptomyces pristinaespiralis TaxID=38300 RepID=A0A0M4DHW3_STRPR|nr:hypothetical protein SPRI_2711 [Streptomyces pristinaespiralis]